MGRAIECFLRGHDYGPWQRALTGKSYCPAYYLLVRTCRRCGHEHQQFEQYVTEGRRELGPA